MVEGSCVGHGCLSVPLVFAFIFFSVWFWKRCLQPQGTGPQHYFRHQFAPQQQPQPVIAAYNPNVAQQQHYYYAGSTMPPQMAPTMVVQGPSAMPTAMAMPQPVMPQPVAVAQPVAPVLPVVQPVMPVAQAVAQPVEEEEVPMGLPVTYDNSSKV